MIGVNLLWCLPDEVGGSEQYLVRQLAGAMQVDPSVDLTLFTTRAFQERHGELLAGARFVESSIDGHRRSTRVAFESTWLRRRTSGMDLVHHGGGTAPPLARRPFVLTVHDLQYRTFPQYFSPLKRRYLDLMIPGSARRAAIVTVPSQYVCDSVVREFGIDQDRVMVVPHGYEPELLSERTPADEVRARFGLGDGPVLVFPAMTAPHKNHAFLVGLMRERWTDPSLRLVFIGGRGAADDQLAGLIATAPDHVRDRIVRPGRVDDADKNGLIAAAAALVFPSTYEGFGAPLIEAMALGAPFICSDATCLPDVAGGAGVVAPLDPDAWGAALHRVLAEREQLVAAGHRRAEAFTSAASGAALLRAYARAA